MPIQLLDGSLTVDVFYEPSDSEYEDNICISFIECCPEEEKVFFAGETNLFLTPRQAQQLAQALLAAAAEAEG